MEHHTCLDLQHSAPYYSSPPQRKAANLGKLFHSQEQSRCWSKKETPWEKQQRIDRKDKW